MAPEHISAVDAVHGVGPDGRPCEPPDDPGAVAPAAVVDGLLRSASTEWWPRVNRRLALPPAVAEAFLTHGKACWLDGTCDACRLPLSWRLHGPGEGTGVASGARVFERCPECGSAEII